MQSLPTEPNELTASEAASLIAERKLSVEELTRSCLKRIADRDEAVKAWTFLSPEMAIGKAKELDKVLIHAGSRGPLHGLPFGVKDMIDSGDMPTTNNSPIYGGHEPAQDAQVVRVMAGSGHANGRLSHPSSEFQRHLCSQTDPWHGAGAWHAPLLADIGYIGLVWPQPRRPYSGRPRLPHVGHRNLAGSSC